MISIYNICCQKNQNIFSILWTNLFLAEYFLGLLGKQGYYVNGHLDSQVVDSLYRTTAMYGRCKYYLSWL